MNTQGAMNNFMKEIMEYSTETMDLYSIYYSAKVIAIYNEFKLRGLTDRKMDENADVRYPTNEIGIRYIAEGLGALAQRLP